MDKTIGERIAEYRKLMKMTQEELAEKLGVSGQAVSKWENDISCPDIMTLPLLADIFGISVDELIRGKEKNEARVLPPEQRRDVESLMLKVVVESGEGDNVKINLPLTLLKMGMNIAGRFANAEGNKGNAALFNALNEIDMDSVMAMAQAGMLGKIVEVKSADGDIVEIYVE